MKEVTEKLGVGKRKTRRPVFWRVFGFFGRKAKSPTDCWWKMIWTDRAHNLVSLFPKPLHRARVSSSSKKSSKFGSGKGKRVYSLLKMLCDFPFSNSFVCFYTVKTSGQSDPCFAARVNRRVQFSSTCFPLHRHLLQFSADRTILFRVIQNIRKILSQRELRQPSCLKKLRPIVLCFINIPSPKLLLEISEVKVTWNFWNFLKSGGEPNSVGDDSK